MSRKVRDAALDTRAARSRLKPNAKPYFRLMEPGLHLGYRRLVSAGMPLIVVARNLGHASTKMVEQHYGHLAASFIAESVRAHAPTFGFEREAVVLPVRARAH
jgi:hypothetical protein